MTSYTFSTSVEASPRNIFRSATFSLVALLAGSSAAHAQETQAAFDEAARRAVVQSAAKALEQRYVFPEVGRRAAEVIEAAVAAGNYAGEDPARFAALLAGRLARTV